MEKNWNAMEKLWKNYGKAMEFLFWGSVRTLSNLGPISTHLDQHLESSLDDLDLA